MNTATYSHNNQSDTSITPEDAPSALYAVLGFFIPLAGLILWLITRNDKPKQAMSGLKGAALNLGLSLIFALVMFFAMSSVMMPLIQQIHEISVGTPIPPRTSSQK